MKSSRLTSRACARFALALARLGSVRSGGLLRGCKNCDELVGFDPQFLQLWRRSQYLRGFNEFEPEERLVCFLDEDPKLCDEVTPRSGAASGPVIRGVPVLARTSWP